MTTTPPPPDDAPAPTPAASAAKPKKKRIRPPRTGQPSGAQNRRKALGCPLATPDGRDCTPEEVQARVQWIADLRAAGPWNATEVKKLAERWRVKVRTVMEYAARAGAVLRASKGNRKERRLGYLVRLEEVAEAAFEAGKFADSIRAYVALLEHDAPPAPRTTRPNLTAEGLPPELAKLKAPPATPDEVLHFAEVDESSCTHTGCRVHPRAEAGPVPPAGGAGSTSGAPMH